MSFVALVGNLTEGFRAVGPFESFEAAADALDGEESWIMEMNLDAAMASGRGET